MEENSNYNERLPISEVVHNDNIIYINDAKPYNSYESSHSSYFNYYIYRKTIKFMKYCICTLCTFTFIFIVSYLILFGKRSKDADGSENNH